MTSTLLANELSTLSSEAKRKNTELRNAADKSLHDLKTLTVTSEQQLAADLRSRPAFVEPFLLACSTRNAKLAASGISCLQRLIVSAGLPRSRLQETLQALNSCADLGLDVQLKILQALPSLIQNYATDLRGDLLGVALQLCASLQAAKTTTISGVAAATLQSLVTTVFGKVATEDQSMADSAETVEVPGGEGPIHLRPAAYDAFRVFRDLALAADERPTKFVGFQQSLPSLELLWSSIDAHHELFACHEELLAIIGANAWPLIIRALSEKPSFPFTVRALRLLSLVLDRYLSKFPEECGVALNLCTQALEYDHATPWKRTLVMELLRGLFIDGSKLIDAYMTFDLREAGKPVVQDMLSAFVRLSTEKPVAIGLGQQSSIPTGPTTPSQSASEQATLEAAGGMAGVISFGATFGVAEASIAGVSSQWSLPRSLVLDQLDKHDPPNLPETYPYALILDCLSGLSDSLAKIILPLTVHHEKRKVKAASSSIETRKPSSDRARTSSFRTRAVPLNPLDAKTAPYAERASAVAHIVDRLWPAVLATASTFLNAALDDQYFRNLIKAYQRFVQVAGVLRLSTPRDALMTTLAKAAVPPHVLNAAVAEPIRSPNVESPRVFSNPKSLLSVDSLVSQASAMSIDGKRRSSLEHNRPMLTVRNLLCLRALLNIAIALGPTLDAAFAVVVSALKQADTVLSTTTPQQLTRQSSVSAHGSIDTASVVQAFSAEVANVEKAASNLLESTADYPNASFTHVLTTFCQLLHSKSEGPSSPLSPTSEQRPTTPRTVLPNRRTFSGLPGISAVVALHSRDFHFVLPKLGKLAELNVTRFTNDDPHESGWTDLVNELARVAKTNDVPRDARRGATNVLVRLAEATVAQVVDEEPDQRAAVQRRALATLLRIIEEIYLEEGHLSQTDLEVQSYVFESLRAILEMHGDSLVAGWNRVLAIISSAFEHDGATPGGADDDQVNIDWTHISFELVTQQIGRTAFDAIQLLCSDFMATLPAATIPSLIELLHRFMCQFDDLNASLTTVTMSLTVSDHLFAKCSESEIDAFMKQASEFDELEDEMQPILQTSCPAQWLTLVLRLRDVAIQPQHEIRNAAYQTICGVLKSHGDELLPNSWELLLRSTLLQISRADSYSYLESSAPDNHESTTSTSVSPNIAMSSTIIQGQSIVVAKHISIIEQMARLPSLWELLLNVLERYMDQEDYTLNTAAYSSLARILAVIEPSKVVWQSPIYRTVSLWLKRVPHFTPSNGNHGRKKQQSNQDAYIAYVEAGDELYRLTRDSLSLSQARTLIDNLFHTIRDADGPLYGADANVMSALQTNVLSLLKKIRLSHPGCLITVAAKIATLHHDTMHLRESGYQGPTFIAIASEAIAWLEDLVLSSISESNDFDPDAIALALRALQQLVEAKYGIKAEHKGTPLWQKAVSSALAIAGPAVEKVARADQAIRNDICTALVGIMGGILSSDNLDDVQDAQIIYDDQLFDMEKFHRLRDILVPQLMDAALHDALRQSYACHLFKASIIHLSETSQMMNPSQVQLNGIGEPRNGRVARAQCSRREDLAYICWKELTILASHDEQPYESTRMAQIATPLLIHRLAMPIKAYIADQPLRGKRPQPLSELEELLFSFECIGRLRLPAHALAGEAGSKLIKQDSAQVHLQFLYPLLVQAVRTAGDRWSGAEEVLEPLQSLLLAVHMPM
ncbi:Putative protein Mon2, guanine nucleotide exchange factor [Septoria linicola]|uniref:Endosomal peripheral membrane protein n=1 Tax=Septoria linicola TaxID=215465 RepID=A0A9Q9AHA6_9PEZI|nr:putative protein Mon2, guanine nucleotide exchange factor [Septoria linicola]USW47649.1 Putative protein Mon2, guanine nucleotide exchange factor [Septoria linicola]